MNDVVFIDHIQVLEVFDATKLVSLQCGRRDDKKILRDCGEAFYEEYGVKEIKQLMKVVSKMPNVRENEINFDHGSSIYDVNKRCDICRNLEWLMSPLVDQFRHKHSNANT